jgi:multiple sugar transport system permease protein
MSPTSSRHRSDQWAALAFCAPYVIVFVLGTIAPLVYSTYLGLFRSQVIGGTSFAGLANYVRALGDALLWESYGRVLLYALVQVPVMLVLALVAALILDSGRVKHVAVPRILLFLPYAVPSVIASLMWSYLLGDEYGLVGDLWGLVGAAPPDLLSGQLILVAIGNIVLWGFLGYNMLIYYSALKVVPEEIYEAARIDGAGEFRVAWSIKLRHIRAAIVMTVVFSLIGAMQLFNEPNLLQVVAPESISSSFTPNMYSYRLAFSGQNVNYAAAVALIVGLITMAIVSIVRALGDRWADD